MNKCGKLFNALNILQMKLSVSDIIHSYLYLYCQVKSRKTELIRVVIGHIRTLTVRRSVSLSSKRETSSQGKNTFFLWGISSGRKKLTWISFYTFKFSLTLICNIPRKSIQKEDLYQCPIFSYFLSLKSYLFSS